VRPVECRKTRSDGVQSLERAATVCARNGLRAAAQKVHSSTAASARAAGSSLFRASPLAGRQ
jgi:hypothetical protein